MSMNDDGNKKHKIEKNNRNRKLNYYINIITT